MRPRLRSRRSLRLRGYDYAAPAAYFITIVTHRRQPLLARVVHGRVELTPAGRLVHEEWFRSARLRVDIALDAFVVMPDHVHGIVFIGGGGDRRSGDQRRGDRRRGDQRRGDRRRGDLQVAPTGPSPLNHPIRPRGPAPNSLGAFVAGFKASATVRINQMRNAPGVPVWQRNYHERVIRDEPSLARIRRYIENSPAQWGDE